jgi:hypothetical protein
MFVQVGGIILLTKEEVEKGREQQSLYGTEVQIVQSAPQFGREELS